MDAPVRAYRGDGPYIFLCWSHDDAAVVHQDLAWLVARGINVWYDEGISAGSNWRGEIAKRLEGASRVLFYVSRGSLASDHCNREINYALDNGREVIPVYLEAVELTPDLKIGLARVHALQRATDPHFERHLLEALSSASADGAPREQKAAPIATPADSVPARRSRRAPTAIVAAVVAAIALVAVGIAYWRESAPPEPPPIPSTAAPPPRPAPSIAVLPFVNLSDDPQNEYFGDGVADEILNALDRIEQLRVAARTSAFSFKGKDTGIKDIAGALGVANVLEGSVRRDGDRVRINVELIDAASGFRIWSSSFDRDVHDIFAVQDEIAAAVAHALQAKLSPSRVPGATTASVEAYNALLKGRALTTYARDESNRAAIGYLKQAVALDPSYGAAWGELAVALALSTAYQPFTEVAQDWSAAFTRALEINPRDSNALAAKAHFVTLQDWDWKTAGALYRQSLDAGISSQGAILYGTMYLSSLGRNDELRTFYSGVLDTDPFNVDILWDSAIWLTLSGRPQEGIARWDRLLETQPASFEAWVGKADAYASLGDTRAARAALERVDIAQVSPYVRHEYLRALLLLGEKDEAALRLAQFEAEGSRGPGYHAGLTWSYVVAGDLDKAFAGYEAGYVAKEITVLPLRASPLHEKLQDDPRYAALLEKMHLDDASLRAAGLL